MVTSTFVRGAKKRANKADFGTPKSAFVCGRRSEQNVSVCILLDLLNDHLQWNVERQSSASLL